MIESKKEIRKYSLIKPKYIILISVVIALLMIISAYYELNENKQEAYHLLNEYANSMIYTVDKSSANTIVSDQEMENLLSQHLIGVAKNVARLETVTKISNNILNDIAAENEIYRINIFDKNGDKLYSNYVSDSVHIQQKGKYSPKDFIEPILQGKESEIVIGLKEARLEKGSRYAVAVKRMDNAGGAIVVNLNAESYLEFRKKIGFGKMITDIGEKSGIEYIVLQNDKEIVAANKQVEGLSKTSEDPFLKSIYNKDTTAVRVHLFKDKKVYEVIKPFIIEGENLGLFRIGLSMDEITNIENRMYRRAAIISFILIVISVIVIGVIVSNQNYNIVSEEYKKIKTFTGDILANMSQAVITINKFNEVEIFNRNAELMFLLKSSNVIGKKINEIFSLKSILLKILIEKKEVYNYEIQCEINNAEKKIISVSSTSDYDEYNVLESYTVVISDVTNIKNVEKQKQQNEKLIAMGELASAVAHEVRNPLNSINMISQRFEKEFFGKIDSDEFKTLTSVLSSESIRVNGIIEQFLRFARPPKLQLLDVNVLEFSDEIKSIFEILAKPKNIEFTVNCSEDKIIKIDSALMKQVILNLLQNALDSVSEYGKIEFNFKTKPGKFIFEVKDDGEGIKEEYLNKVFDLYFTTKSHGTGLGLSIVQQIVNQHNGSVYVESEFKKGSVFTIEIPNN
jgi:signal transduction histidine kinase